MNALKVIGILLLLPLGIYLHDMASEPLTFDNLGSRLLWTLVLVGILKGIFHLDRVEAR